MDISHWKCRALQFFDFKETVKAFFTQKRRFYLKLDVFFWTVGRRNLLMLEAFKRLFGEN